MRPDIIRSVFRRQPFQPIRVCLVDGTSYEIRHPDQIAVARSTLTIAGTVAHLPAALVDSDVIVALVHISRLEPIEALAAPPTSSN